MAEEEDKLHLNAHYNFMRHMSFVLPSGLQSQDSNRATLMYFVIACHEILGKADKLDRNEIVENVYNMQVLPDKDDPKKNSGKCGFRGGTFFGKKWNPNCEPTSSDTWDHSHLAMTFSMLCILVMCRDDLSRVNKAGVIGALKQLQRSDGSFMPVYPESENDMRFVYCACAISYMLDDWSGVDKDRVVQYILSSISYDYGIGQGPGQESHGGSTYCAVAALALMERLHVLPNREGLIQWCIERQHTGFQGRIDKPPDTCYSFWIGAVLNILGAEHLINVQLLRGHTLSCTSETGGLSKVPEVIPDPLHTYLGLAGLALTGEPSLKKVFAPLGFSQEAVDDWRKKKASHD